MARRPVKRSTPKEDRAAKLAGAPSLASLLFDLRSAAKGAPSLKDLQVRMETQNRRVSYGYLAALEAGRETNPSEDILGYIADALRLSQFDRRRLIDAKARSPLVATGVDVPFDRTLDAQGAVDEIWLLFERPLEISDEDALVRVAQNIQNGVHYLYVLPTLLRWQAELRPRLLRFLSTELLDERVTCAIAEHSILRHFLFLPARALHLKEGRLMAATWAKESDQQGVHAVYKMEDFTAGELFKLLSPIIAGIRSAGRVPIPGTVEFIRVHPELGSNEQK